MNNKSIIIALIVVLIWGINFSIIKFGLEELPPILFSALRFTVVAIPAVFFIPFPKTPIINVLGVGLFLGIIKFSLLFIAMKEDASAGISSLILQAQVFFTIILSLVFFKEHLSKIKIMGILIAMIGFSLFFFNPAENITLFGLVLILMSAFFWSLSNIIMKQLKDVNLVHFIIWISLIPPIPLAILSYYFESSTPIELLFSTSSQAWFSVIYVGYISTLIAFAMWAWLLKNNKAADVTPFALLIPVVGIITSNILLNEKLTSIEYIASILIMIGLIISVMGKNINATKLHFIKP